MLALNYFAVRTGYEFSAHILAVFDTAKIWAPNFLIARFAIGLVGEARLIASLSASQKFMSSNTGILPWASVLPLSSCAPSMALLASSWYSVLSSCSPKLMTAVVFFPPFRNAPSSLVNSWSKSAGKWSPRIVNAPVEKVLGMIKLLR